MRNIHGSTTVEFMNCHLDIDYSIFVDRGDYHTPPSTDFEYQNITIHSDDGAEINGFFLLEIAEDYFLNLEDKLIEEHEV